ncbi:hypothetical protein BD309DRAFT_887948 [Dichomitus squalens]|uniref:Uncharacterized protein n=1 Tax=Dichomitus squalens TaxID=114155 RepID=A0A4Q9PSV3_9APHY|nr:hypothetical protein BD309DRAFT_887948 [Dichomitus squalens]TBU57501.1 hypothetical protein BD310DRAFT_853001 [Dichomitus squalens]
MRLLTLLLLAVPATVSACEGDCIVGTTNAWLSNYTAPIQTAMESIATQISRLIPSHPSIDTTFNYLNPIITAYHDQSYQNMENGIFPSYFHGKCLDKNGNEPAGCPNPDCPVVCGTPGSMVHFFPKLRYIAFNQTLHLLETLSSPGSPSYDRMEELVLDASQRPPDERRRRGFSRVFSRSVTDGINVMQNNKNGAGSLVPGLGLVSGSGSGLGSGPGSLDLISGVEELAAASSSSSNMLAPALPKRAQDIKAGLKTIMAQIPALMEEACGGTGDGEKNGLPHCSWEVAMKEYILTFP